MTTKHTLGPWELSDQGVNGVFITANNNKGAIAKVYNENSLVETREEAIANAKLIAQSPKLLEMLNHAVELLTDLGHGKHHDVEIYRQTIKDVTE